MTKRALILAAHGSRHEPAANAQIRQIAAALAKRGGFDAVVAAFHQGAPTFGEVLDAMDADDVTVVPVMTSEGFYCDEFLPAQLAKNRRFHDMRIRQTPPVGVHPDIAGIVAARIAEICSARNLDPRQVEVAIVGHGTPRNPKSRLATQSLFAALQSMAAVRRVAGFFLDESPGVEEISTVLDSATIVVIPFFISPGPHVRRDIPRRLGLADSSDQLPRECAIGDRRILIDDAVGTYPAMIDVIWDLAQGPRPMALWHAPMAGANRLLVLRNDEQSESTKPSDPSDCFLFSTPTGVKDRSHGRKPVGTSRATPVSPRQGRRNVRAGRPHSAAPSVRKDDYSAIDPRAGARGYVPCAPTGAKSPRRAGANRVISDVLLAGSTKLEAAPHAHSATRFTSTAKHRSVLRLGTRGSRLALRQAEIVVQALRERGAQVEIVELLTLGDRITDRAIGDLPSSAPFCDEIEDALRRGDIDLAVHSRKDLNVAQPDDLRLAAILPRGPVEECLVSRNGLRLDQLPPGAVIGTSSPRRVAQLLAMRPDVTTATIRGPVEARVAQVRDGRFDAAILAAAGLERLDMSGEAAETLSLDDVLPAPAQGAMAVQVRADDATTLNIVAALDDAPTRLAITAELEFLRPFEFDADRIAAAVATISGETITLRARLLSADGQVQSDATVSGTDPIELAAAAIDAVTSERLHKVGVAR